MIHDRYRTAFTTIPPEELALLVSSLQFPPDCQRSGEEFYNYCRQQHVSHADVIMSLARDTTPLAVRCVERLIMRPIDRRTPAEVNISRLERPPSIVAAPVRTRSGDVDERVVTILAPANPKRPGSASHARFALYATGQTVDAFLALGGKRADVSWDVEHGHISLADPQS